MIDSESETPSCDYCGLPLVFIWRPKPNRPQTEGPFFCCLGCRIAAQVTAEKGEAGQTKGTLARLGIGTFFAMNVMVFTLVLWSQDLYAVSDARAMPRVFAELLRYLSLLFSLPVLFLLGQPLVENAWKALSEGRPSTDLLVIVGVLAAFFYSMASILRGQGDTYFEVSTMVLVFVTLGRWLEASGRIRAGDAITQLEKLLPELARKKTGGEFVETALEEIQPGDLVMIRAGERCPVDGEIVEGSGAFDEQILTGESTPIGKSPGETLLAGSLNLDGTLVIESSSSAREGTLSRLVHLVRQAQSENGPAGRLADRVAGWFLPLIALIAVLTFAWWGSQSQWETGLLSAFAVVLVSCPCSLGLATPLAVWTALAKAAKRQVLFTSGQAVEELAGVRAVRFDKTGTLTTGEPRLKSIIASPETSESEVMERARRISEHSTHVFSQAIVRAGKEPSSTVRPLKDVRTWPGLGISAVDPDSNSSIVLGSRRFLEEQGLSLDETLLAASKRADDAAESVCYVGWENQVKGLLIFAESIRPEARQAVQECRKLGLDVAVLTGDREARGRVLSEELKTEVAWELLPHEKVERIQLARAEYGKVAMVGDGVNDAAALAAADVGIALGSGADITRDTAGVCLLGNDLMKLPWAIRLAQKTLRTIRWNLFWAYGYNTIAIGLAVCGLLNPIAAAGLMVLSSVFVISNSLRLSGGDEEALASASPISANPNLPREQQMENSPIPRTSPNNQQVPI